MSAKLEKILADDAAWFERHGCRRKRVRLITNIERRLSQIEADMNVAIVSQIEPGLRTRTFIAVPPDHIDYALRHGDKVVGTDFLIIPGCEIDGKILD